MAHKLFASLVLLFLVADFITWFRTREELLKTIQDIISMCHGWKTPFTVLFPKCEIPHCCSIFRRGEFFRALGKSQYLTGNRFVHVIFATKDVKHTNSLLNITLISFQKNFKILIKNPTWVYRQRATQSTSHYHKTPRNHFVSFKSK